MKTYGTGAAMMSALAGVSLTFISMTFALQIFETPSLSLLPLIVILVTYAAHVQLPLKIPSGIAAMATGTLIAWSLRWYGVNYFDPPPAGEQGLHSQALYLPQPAFGLVWDAIQDPMSWQYITVVLPMLLVNIVSNLACVESASTVGDNYSTPKVCTFLPFCV
jgi:AGZA family xanthine/uracil permease-like MFS transporter